ncbi:uncharacterized protein LOC126901868 isoform X2 [Daktulosphaira vitifoliae]|uniref:uncharacterized protein LOC126901868 isoform X2 n=1 Tax=Daktulosphaira vitifoliae TaxID=58002 RepID=UPI0021AA575D|nr:uncharacterized protein LOC126901868 isoform X2 [Daktulosphaira vitifoliae]
MQTKIREKIVLSDQTLRILSLYCNFNPFNLNVIRNFNFFQYIFALLLLVEFIVVNCYVFIGLYYVINDFFAAVQLCIKVLCSIQIFVNTYRLSTKYDELRKLFDATSGDFLSSSHKGKYIFERYKSICTKITNTYIFINLLGGLVWILNPLFLKKYPLKKRDGSLEIYRNNVVNSVLSFIPISIYDKIYPIVFVYEAIEIIHVIFDLIIYNTIVMKFCWMLSAQLNIIAFRCKSFECKNNEFGQGNDINNRINLKQLLSDHTKLNVSIKKFYEIMKPMTMYSFGYSFNVFIGLTYMFILNYFKSDHVLSVMSVKLFFAALIDCNSLFIMCYFYSYLESQINVVQFAMYSVDWTAKSIKFKKMLLLAMNLNTTNKLKMEITPQKTINLEVFASAMRVSYSIVSLLAKKTNMK